MSSLPNRLQRSAPSDSILPLHHPPGGAESSNEGSSSRPRPGGLRIPAWFSSTPVQSPASTTRIEGDYLPTSPMSTFSQGGVTSPRRRAHTVSVSLGRQRGSISEEKPLTGSALPTHSEDEGNAEGDGEEEAAPANRRESIMDRIRESIDERERRDSQSNNPVSYEVLRNDGSGGEDDLNDEIVGMLDVVDPQVSTVNHLQNMTNGIVIPHFPALWSRRPEIVLRSSQEDVPKITTPSAPPTSRSRRSTVSRPRSSTVAALFPPSSPVSAQPPPNQHTLTTIPSTPLDTSDLAPQISTECPTAGKSPDSPSSSTDGLTPMEEHDLDLHVRRVLKKSKREKAKELLKGTWVFLKTPIGIVVGIYGVLVVFWGAALVLILIDAIPLGSLKAIWVERCSQILNGLFTLTGIGLIPWRVIDTYRMVIIAKYKHRTRVLRNKRGLPPIEDPNDLPDPKDQADYVAVLTEKEQEELRYQQEKFAKSQTWYKPHATATHRAFPISWALWNTILMDGNSFFQCFLCGCMWGINYKVRPAWTTGSLIPLSFLCGIGAGVLIWRGGVNTKKVASVEDKLRQALGVPLAIAMPKTKDGTIITGANKSPIGLPTDYATSKPPDASSSPDPSAYSGKGDDIPLQEKRSPSDTDHSEAREEVILGPNKKVEVKSPRRSTVTFGQIADPLFGHKGGEAKEEAEIQNRNRGKTVAAAPTPISERGETPGGLEGIELEKVKSGETS